MLEGETRGGRISTVLGLSQEEVLLRFLLPLDWWRQLPRNGELIWVSLLAQWMCNKLFDNVSPESLSLIMKEMDTAPMLAGAVLSEQIGRIYDICFQETRVSGIPFDKSIKQSGTESPSLFIVMMRGVFKPLQEKWKEEKMGVGMRKGEGQQEEYKVSHMIFADTCYLFATSKEENRKMIADTTEELRNRGLDWKDDQMELEDITQESPAQDPSVTTSSQLGYPQLPTTASQSISHFPTGLW